MRILVIVGIVAGLVLLAGGLWWLLYSKDDDPQSRRNWTGGKP